MQGRPASGAVTQRCISNGLPHQAGAIAITLAGAINDPKVGIRASNPDGRRTAQGREYQFAAGDSGRSGDLDGGWRWRRRLHIHERSLSTRDWRQADDCCVAATAHRGRVVHRRQPLLGRRTMSNQRIQRESSHLRSTA